MTLATCALIVGFQFQGLDKDEPRNARIDTKVQKDNGARPAGRSGGVFAKASESLLASAFSKQLWHSRSESTLCFIDLDFYFVSVGVIGGPSSI